MRRWISSTRPSGSPGTKVSSIASSVSRTSACIASCSAPGGPIGSDLGIGGAVVAQAGASAAARIYSGSRKFRVGGTGRFGLLDARNDYTLGIKQSGLDAQVRVRRRSGDILEDFFGRSLLGQLETVSVASEPVEIEVLPLPSGQPRAFSGFVGDLTVNATVDRLAVEHEHEAGDHLQ